MRGWLIYDKEGAARNAWFIQRLQEEGAANGLQITLRVCEKDETFAGELPDFAIVRTVYPRLNERLEKKGVRVFNNAKTSALANDKWQTYVDCKRWGIPVLPTALAAQQFPVVMKSVDGHGGTEVFWANDKKEYQTIEQNFTRQGKRFIAQTPCDILGKDMRVYAIGGEIIAAVLRTSQTQFKSNFSLGGTVELAQADETQRRIVERLYEKLRFDFVGIDFLPSGKGWVLNEIEDAAGARMLYACSDIDVVKLFIQHVVKSL
jgi:RimK family alpha-L-glutamate ligase